MTVFTYEKVKRLMAAAETMLANIYDAGDHAPRFGSPEDSEGFPRDEDGDIVYPDVWELHQALDALEVEDGDTVPAGWDKIEADDASDEYDLRGEQEDFDAYQDYE